MKTVVLIPARLQSKRFPNKPLAMIAGKAVIEHCYDWASQAGFDTYVVSGDEEILSLFHGKCIPTFANHNNGTERCFEAAKTLKLENEDIIINVQGDIVSCDPDVLVHISERQSNFKSFHIFSVMQKMETSDYFDTNAVKVLCNTDSNAIFFSRDPFMQRELLRSHVGIYCMQMLDLTFYRTMGQCEWEKEQSLEQMRWMYWGIPITMYMDYAKSTSINTPEDIQKAEEKWQNK